MKLKKHAYEKCDGTKNRSKSKLFKQKKNNKYIYIYIYIYMYIYKGGARWGPEWANAPPQFLKIIF